MGGVFASFFALFCTGWNHWALLGHVPGGRRGRRAVGALPAVFKPLEHEQTLFTLMLNYIALYLVSYLQANGGPWQVRGGKRF